MRCADHWADYITINEAGTANVGGMEPFDQIAKMIAAAPVMLSALQEFAAGRGRIKTARAIVAKLERKK